MVLDASLARDEGTAGFENHPCGGVEGKTTIHTPKAAARSAFRPRPHLRGLGKVMAKTTRPGGAVNTK